MNKATDLDLDRMILMDRLFDEIDHERWIPVSITNDDRGCNWCGVTSTEKNERHDVDCVFASALWKQYKAGLRKTEALTSEERRMVNGKLADLTKGNLTLAQFLDQARRIHPSVAKALDGIWAGLDGRAMQDLPGDEKHCLVVGWYNGRAEYAYIS